jgi:hypothetical protein
MRKIFQIDGLDNSVLSVGECKEPQRAALCIRDSQGNEIHMLIGQESFRELCSLSYDIHWTPEPRAQEREEELPL